jgi:hypothetical protein
MGNDEPLPDGACGARRRKSKLAITATNKTAPTIATRIIRSQPAMEDVEVQALLRDQFVHCPSITVAE